MEYRNVTLEELEKLALGPGKMSPLFLYVQMPSTGEWAVFVQKDEPVSAQRWENLKGLIQLKNLFVNSADLPAPPEAIGSSVAPPAPVAAPAAPASKFPPHAEAYDRDALSAKGEAALKAEFKELSLDAKMHKGKVSATITKMADDLYKFLVPEVESFRDSLMGHLKNLQQLNDAAAIATLAVLCATANDFKSKTAYQNLCLTTLLMDAALSEILPSELETYYRNRSELPEHIREKIRNHPLKSQQMVAYMPQVNDAINQMILMHHELHNGSGYHRGIRSASAPAIVRVLALAVDLYEYIRGAELNGQNLDINAALKILLEPGVEPHLRRHAKQMVDNVVTYLKK